MPLDSNMHGMEPPLRKSPVECGMQRTLIYPFIVESITSQNHLDHKSLEVNMHDGESDYFSLTMFNVISSS